MDLNYFEVKVNGRFHPVPRSTFNDFEKSMGKTGYTITIWDSNIEAAKMVVNQYNIEYISSRTQDLEYLLDPVFSNIKGISIHGQMYQISNLKPRTFKAFRSIKVPETL